MLLSYFHRLILIPRRKTEGYCDGERKNENETRIVINCPEPVGERTCGALMRSKSGEYHLTADAPHQEESELEHDPGDDQRYENIQWQRIPRSDAGVTRMMSRRRGKVQAARRPGRKAVADGSQARPLGISAYADGLLIPLKDWETSSRHPRCVRGELRCPEHGNS